MNIQNWIPPVAVHAPNTPRKSAQIQRKREPDLKELEWKKKKQQQRSLLNNTTTPAQSENLFNYLNQGKTFLVSVKDDTGSRTLDTGSRTQDKSLRIQNTGSKIQETLLKKLERLDRERENKRQHFNLLHSVIIMTFLVLSGLDGAHHQVCVILYQKIILCLNLISCLDCPHIVASQYQSLSFWRC